MCVASKKIDGSQCTKVFYVDDNKISHKGLNVVTKVIEEISKKFGEMKVTRGSKFDYLGMKIEVKEKKVEIDMKDQIMEAIDWYKLYSEGKITSPSTPVAKHLFMPNDNAETLDDRQKQVFHSIVAKLFYVTKGARPDIEPGIASYVLTCHVQT